MASVLAALSRARFERLFKGARRYDELRDRTLETALGALAPLRRFLGTPPELRTLRDGGALFLVTVRPSDRLWLVAVLEKPRANRGILDNHPSWALKPPERNVVPITDITALRDGLGLDARPGNLTAALRTPRPLTPAQVELLRAVVGGTAAVSSRT